jgi:uncharacterized coiled-coil DUF342 family protein
METKLADERDNVDGITAERNQLKEAADRLAGENINAVRQLGESAEMIVSLRAERDMARGEVATLKEERHILQGKLEASEFQAKEAIGKAELAESRVVSLLGKLEVCEKERQAALKEARIFYWHASGDASGLQEGDVDPLTDKQRAVIVGENKDGN